MTLSLLYIDYIEIAWQSMYRRLNVKANAIHELHWLLCIDTDYIDIEYIGFVDIDAVNVNAASVIRGALTLTASAFHCMGADNAWALVR